MVEVMERANAAAVTVVRRLLDGPPTQLAHALLAQTAAAHAAAAATPATASSPVSPASIAQQIQNWALD